MDRFILNYYGNKYNETKKYLHDEILKFNFDYVAEPFGGIFGFSRYYYLLHPNTKFLINDIDKDMIDFYKNLKNNFDEIIKKLEDLHNRLPNDKNIPSIEGKKLLVNESNTIKKIFLGLCPSFIDIHKGKTKIKNFIEKKDEYKKLFSQMEFYNLTHDKFIDEIKNKKNLLIYFDPPYFNSNNKAYNDNFLEGEYADGTSMYIDIFNFFKSNKLNCLFVMNKIDIINYLFKKYIYKEYKGKYQTNNGKNKQKRPKHHIIYKNFIKK